MNIAFDIFINHPELTDQLSVDEHLFYTELLNFVRRQLLPLEDAINKEEEESNEGMGTIIYIEDVKKSLSFIGYSIGLREKMNACFSQGDFSYVFTKIENLIKMRNN